MCAEALQLAVHGFYVTVNGTQHFVKKNRILAVLGHAIFDVVLCKICFEFRDHKGSPLLVSIQHTLTN